MFSLIRKALTGGRSLNELFNRIDQLEKRLDKLEAATNERDSLWFFVEEMKRQEEEAYEILQDELQDAFVRGMKPRGEA